MTENDTMTNESETERRYLVNCEKCGVVEFEVLAESWFGNKHAALYYAGYHDGKVHPESDSQLSLPKEQQDGDGK